MPDRQAQASRNSEVTPLRSVDVVIPVYNGERYIIAALASAAAQTHPPAKIVVVDDGSTDGTPALVRGFAGPVPVEYLRKPNGGLSSARNAGIARCTSDYIAFLDADDAWHPAKLAEQLKVFAAGEFADLGAVYCGYEIVDEMGDRSDSFFVLDIDSSLRGRIFERLFYGNKVAGSGSAVLAKRECFDTVGCFDETLAAFEDWDMWLRIARNYSFDFVPQALVKIRRHDDNMQKDARFMLTNQLRFQDKWCQAVSADADCVKQWRDGICWQLYRHESFRMTRLATQLLSSGSRKRLFGPAFGSVWLYLAGFVMQDCFSKITRALKIAGKNKADKVPD